MDQTNFVPAIRRRDLAPPPMYGEIVHTIDAPLAATQHVEVKTSSVDRAVGHLISYSAIAVLFGGGVVGICFVGWSVPIMSTVALVIFWLSALACWIITYAWELHTSPEGVSLYEAKQKWDVIRTEQDRRWGAWYDQNEREESTEWI